MTNTWDSLLSLVVQRKKFFNLSLTRLKKDAWLDGETSFAGWSGSAN